MNDDRRGVQKDQSAATADASDAPSSGAARRNGVAWAITVTAALSGALLLSLTTPLGQGCATDWLCPASLADADAPTEPLDLGPLETAEIDRRIDRAERQARQARNRAQNAEKRRAAQRDPGEEAEDETLFGPAAALKRIEDARAAVEEAENGRRSPPALSSRRLWAPTGGVWRIVQDDVGWVAGAVIQIGQQRPDLLGLVCTHPAIDGTAYMEAGFRPPPPPSTDGFVFYVGQRFFRRLAEPRKDARPYFLEFDVVGADGERVLRSVLAFTFDRGRGLFVSGVEARSLLLRAFFEGARVTIREDESGAERVFSLSGSRDAINGAARHCGLTLTAPSRPLRGVPAERRGPN